MTREERRKAMPLTTAFVDDIIAHFGRPRSIRATENGHEIVWTDRTAP